MSDDAEVIARLQAGDEGAFVMLVERYHAALLRLATSLVPSRAIAEEVVQDTWLGVVKGVERFEGRSSLKTWLFRILVNRAHTTGSRERRAVPIDLTDEPTVPAARFTSSGHWAEPPQPWADDADDRLAAESALPEIRGCLDELSDSQRRVVLLRDVDGVPSKDVCELLMLSEANQRVLLHRGRAKLRACLDGKMAH